MIKKTMTITSIVIAMLGLSLMISGIPLSFAIESTLEAKCDTESERRLSADCELLQRIIDLEEKNAELETKIDKTCAALPVVKSAFGSLISEISTAFGTVNTGIGILNTSVIGPLNAFNLNSISIDPENLNLGNILPDDIHVGTFVVGGVTFVNPTDIFLEFTDLNIDLPAKSAPSFQPFKGIPTIPLVSTAPIDAADDAIQSLLECV